MEKLVDILKKFKGQDFLLSIGKAEDSRNRVRVYSDGKEEPLATFSYRPLETLKFYSEIKEAEKQGYRLNYSARAVFLNGVGFAEFGRKGPEGVSDEECKKQLEIMYSVVKKAKSEYRICGNTNMTHEEKEKLIEKIRREPAKSIYECSPAEAKFAADAEGISVEEFMKRDRAKMDAINKKKLERLAE